MNTKMVCEKINISTKALRVYEEYELIIPKRSDNGYRCYSDENILRLREIMLLKEMGFSLKEIKNILDKNKADREEEKGKKVVSSLNFQMKVIENKIIELDNVKNTLKDSINSIINSKEKEEYTLYFEKINEMLEQNKVKRQQWIDRWGFDNWAKNYDSSVVSGNDELNIFQGYGDIMEKVKEVIMARSPQSILDIGCGTGSLCGELSGEIEVVGIDQSIEMLFIAKDRYPAFIGRVGNFLEEPYLTNHFDVVVSSYAFHHLKGEEKLRAIDNMCEYLKDNGRIVIADLMFLNKEKREKCRRDLINQGREDLWDIVEDEYYSDIEELKEYAELKGLKFYYDHMMNFTWMVVIER